MIGRKGKRDGKDKGMMERKKGGRGRNGWMERGEGGKVI